jgi:hypothetical protein
MVCSVSLLATLQSRELRYYGDKELETWGPPYLYTSFLKQATRVVHPKECTPQREQPRDFPKLYRQHVMMHSDMQVWHVACGGIHTETKLGLAVNLDLTTSQFLWTLHLPNLTKFNSMKTLWIRF